MVISKINISIEDFYIFPATACPAVNMKGGGAYVLINPIPKKSNSKNRRRT